MEAPTLTLIGAIIITPIVTLLTMWLRNSTDKDKRRDDRDDKFIKSLDERVTECETRHGKRDKEIAEIRVELKNRDAEYLTLYQEHTTMRAKYEVLQADHEELKKQYEVTAAELTTLKETIKEDRENTADLASKTAAKTI